MSGLRTVAVLTRDRPVELARSLASHAAHARRHGHAVRLLVLDDAPDPAQQAENRALLAAAAAPGGMAHQYVGAAEKRQLQERLVAAAGVPQAVVEFALFGSPWEGVRQAGTNLNAFMLLTAGERALSFDDDIVCRAAMPAESGTRWGWTEAGDPTEIQCFAEAGRAEQEAQWVEEDLYAALHAPLGQAGSALVPGLPAGPVLLSSLGLRGDSGMGLSAYLLKLQGANRARLLEGGAELFRARIASRQMARSVPHPTVQAPGWFQSYALGVDNTQCLPPWLPVFRGSDTLYPLLLRLCWPQPLQAQLPWQVWHQPPGTRRVEVATFATEAGRTVLGHWFYAAFAMFQQSPAARDAGTAPAEKLQRLGVMWQELTARPAARAVGIIGAWVRQYHEHEAKAVARLLAEHAHEPPYWAEPLAAYQAAVQQALADPLFPTPATYPSMGLPPAETCQKLLEVLREYGRLLEHWPALWQAARGLK